MPDGPEAFDWPPADWRRPSPRLRSVRLVQVALFAVPAVAGGAIGGVEAGGGTGAGIGVAAAAALAGMLYLFVIRRLSAWGYAEREDDLMVRRGVMFRRLSIIPYGRMQYVDISAGPLERSFGLATVRMYTAAAASDARIPGLASNEAARLRDHLTALGEARAAGL